MDDDLNPGQPTGGDLQKTAGRNQTNEVANNPNSAGDKSATQRASGPKRICIRSSIFQDLERLNSIIPKFNLFEHDVSQWISTVKEATSGYDAPDDIMKFLHSFFAQKPMITWFVKEKLGSTKLEDFKDRLEEKATKELIRSHKLADLHLNEYLTEIQFTGKARITEFIQRKLLLFADLYPFFPKEKVHEKIFYQLTDDLIPEFLPYRKAELKVIIQNAQITDGLEVAE